MYVEAGVWCIGAAEWVEWAVVCSLGVVGIVFCLVLM